MPRPAALVLAGAATLALLSGCSEGPDAFNENLPDDQADPPGQLVVRTPGPIPPDLPYSDPPLVVPLPGATGGTPGTVPTASPAASLTTSEGEGEDGEVANPLGPEPAPSPS